MDIESREKSHRFLRSMRGSGLLIIIIAALLVEVISIVQYNQMRNLIRSELEVRTRIGLRFASQMIRQTLGEAESTIQEHLSDLRSDLAFPDSMYTHTVRLISHNPDVTGSFICFIPDYYPAKGRLFEPYSFKADGVIQTEQLGSESHDYTLNPDYQNVIQKEKPFWSDPYLFGDGEKKSLITYSYPVTDHTGRIVAICGLDIELSWLSEMLKSRQRYPSSFGLLLSQHGRLIASADGAADSDQVVRIINDSTVVRRTAESGSSIIDFRSERSGRKGIICCANLTNEPYWQVVQVTYKDEVFAPLRRIRLYQMLLILAGFLILLFMIARFARNARKLRSAELEQARLGGELSVAHRIQMQMLPKDFPKDRQGLDIYGSLVPAREVGGDLFDFFIRDEKLFFCIGDVSGKGVPSAMVMSVTLSLFRMISAKVDAPARIVGALNEECCRDNATNMFITFFLGILDLSSGTLRYCNAGHDQPLLKSADGVSSLPVKAHLPLGVFSDTRFTTQESQLSPGTALFLFTDGLTEARDLDRRLFGRERVISTLEGFQGDVRQTVEALDATVHHFTKGAEQSDDLTMLALRYLGAPVLRETLSLRNDLSEVPRLGAFIKSFSSRHSLDRKTASEFRLAVEEVVVNIISYAYPEGSEGNIEIESRFEDGALLLTIVDAGIPFDPTSVTLPGTDGPAEDRDPGGLGILLTRKLMDDVVYTRSGEKNILTLKKTIL